MVRVFHDDNFLDNYWGAKDPKIEGLKLVAEVDTKNLKHSNTLEHAYMITNNIDKPWQQTNAGVTPHGNKFRSTSCGDVLEHDGRFFVVAETGFREVEDKDTTLRCCRILMATRPGWDKTLIKNL